MTQTVIEKVARIIASAVACDLSSEDIARAAVEAMREPSEAMIAAGLARALAIVTKEVGPEYPDLHFIDEAEHREWFIEHHRAAIDSILQEKPE